MDMRIVVDRFVKVLLGSLVLLLLTIGGCSVRDTDRGIPPGSFPIGVFSAGPPTDQNFAEVKGYGFDYVHRYRLAAADPKYIQNYLDTATRQNLKVMLDVSEYVHPQLKKNEGSVQERLEGLRKCVRRWKSHPSLGFWYLYDEPDSHVSPEELEQFRQVLEEESPDIPNAVAIAWTKNWSKYVNAADIIMPDYYPVREKAFPGSMLNFQTEFFGDIARKCGERIPIVQCFGFPRCPNTAELRYMMYSSLTQKIKGLFFWSYYYARFKPFHGKKNCEFDPAYMRKTFSPVLKEFKEFVKLVKPAHKVLHVPNLSTPELHSARQTLHGIWRRKTDTYVVLINNWPLKRTLSVPFDPHIINATLKPICSTRDVSCQIVKGNLQVEALPWETFIWKVETKSLR